MGYESMENFVIDVVYPEIKQIAKAPVKSYKTMAQENIQKYYKQLPVYVDREEKVDEKGNVLLFRSEIVINEKILASGF